MFTPETFMPRRQSWIISLLASVLSCILLIVTCHHLAAISIHSDQPAPTGSTSSEKLHYLSSSQNANALRKRIDSTNLVTFPYDAILEYSIYPDAGEHVFPNGQLVYTLRISHDKDVPVSGLRLTSTVSTAFVPEKLLVVGATVTELSAYPTYAWQIDDLPPASKAVVYMIGHADSTLSDVGNVINVVTLYNEYEADLTNNEVALSIPITLPSIALNSYAFNVNEANTQIGIDLALDFPNPHGHSYVDYETVEVGTGTGAKGNADYIPVSGTLTISQARSSERFMFDILDDAIDENSETIQVKLFNPQGIRLGSSDMLTVTIIDDDGAGILVDPLVLEMPEDGEALAYNMSLTSQPPEIVHINIDTADNNVLVDKQIITFTATNWEMPQTVAISPVDNFIDEADRTILVNHQVSSLDPIYNSQTASNVTVNIADDDEAAIIVSSTAITTAEEADTSSEAHPAYTIALNSEPTAPVSITFGAEGQLLLDKSVITFTPQTWSLPQVITVTAIDDDVAEGSHNSLIRHITASDDPNYATAEAPAISATIRDNDEVGFILSTKLLTVTEASATEHYTLSLTSRPLHPVTVLLLSDDERIDASPSTLQFSPEEWQTAQTITVSAPSNNSVSDLQIVTIDHQVQSDDAAYNSHSEQITIHVNDSDIASLRTSRDALNLLEGQTSSSQPSDVEAGKYDIALTSRPTDTVSVTIKYSEEINVAPNSFVITPEAWSTPQQVVVSVENDSIFQGHRVFTLTHQLSSADPYYNALSHDVPVRVSDDDSPLRVILKDINLVEGTSSQGAAIMLLKKPTSTVTITLTTNDQLSVEPPVITFTSDDWNTSKAVTLIPNEDNEAESEQQGIVDFAIESEDTNYSSDNQSQRIKLPINDVPEKENATVFLPMISR